MDWVPIAAAISAALTGALVAFILRRRGEFFDMKFDSRCHMNQKPLILAIERQQRLLAGMKSQLAEIRGSVRQIQQSRAHNGDFDRLVEQVGWIRKRLEKGGA